MSALSISESAVSRALGMYDIVAVIASYSSVYQPVGDMQAHWEGSGLLARGVNKLWKEVHDKHIISQLKEAKGTLRLAPHSQSKALPLPLLSVLLSQSTSALYGLRAIRATCSHTSPWVHLHVRVLVHFSSVLASLSLDKLSLSALSKAYAADPTIGFPFLVSLHLELEKEPRTRHVDEQEFALHAPAFVRALKKLNTLYLYPESNTDNVANSPHVHCLNVLVNISTDQVETLRLRPRNIRPEALPDLISIVRQFPNLTRLVLSVQSINAWLLSPNIVPPDLRHLEYEISPRLVPSFLELLANPSFLPTLRTVPVLTLVSRSKTIPTMPRKPKVTMLMVDTAIKGLKERDSIENVDKAAEELYKLVNDRN